MQDHRVKNLGLESSQCMKRFTQLNNVFKMQMHSLFQVIILKQKSKSENNYYWPWHVIITENPFVAVEEGDVKSGPSTLGTPPTGGLFCAVLARGREDREADCGKARAPNVL